MKFALVNDIKAQATKGVIGFCPGCSQPVVAKCGTKKVHHWAHRANKACDSWWEPETQWHRDWKNNFPPEWQEIFLPDRITGEKHIADIRASEGLVIEFQHSHIDPKERLIRENFYKTMVWVVDGTRLKRDYPRFLKNKEYLHAAEKQGIYYIFFPEECFPAAWTESTVPVIFDFRGTKPFTEEMVLTNSLYCLFPVLIGSQAVVAEISQKAFVTSVIKGEWLSKTKKFIDDLNEQQKQKEAERQQFSDTWIYKLLHPPKYKRRRF